MKLACDLHLHSKYSRAVSPEMVLSTMVKTAKKKGIQLLATGDWTYPLWFAELQNSLEETGDGLYKLKQQRTGDDKQDDVYFILSSEISSIYSQNGKVRRIHNLVLAPSLKTAEKINDQLSRLGANLRSDDRPIIGVSAENLAELVLNVDKQTLIIPAHIWTPHFSIFGSESGFDSLEEGFGKMAKHIYAIETGLSSDPAMNWRILELDNRAIMSFSDAHSPSKMGRELTILEIDDLSYHDFYRAVVENKIAFTTEFFPEEGKYHFSGHRNCKVSYSPDELKEKGQVCPICGRLLTVGVATRVEQLASRTMTELEIETDQYGFIHSRRQPNRPSFKTLVPLSEIIADSLDKGSQTKTVIDEYERLVAHFGSELAVLLKVNEQDLRKTIAPRIVEGILKVRQNDITIEPGYDGEYGKVEIWQEEEKGSILNNQSQMALL